MNRKKKITPKEILRFFWNLSTSLIFSWEKCQECRWNKPSRMLVGNSCFSCDAQRSRKPICESVSAH